ncbi:hypothetical protein L2E82_18066 [Cichorium intybus]|uniref:Uncharacterized protein n=1 Tax=Cichorium intybus TaxID=13427 RepID=A0ACB9F8S6_CICIN|nr:hypothetical protein L2E82_18066 [Cichorium intybus]
MVRLKSIKPTGTSPKRFLPSRLLSSPLPSAALPRRLLPSPACCFFPSQIAALLCFSKVPEKVHRYNASDIKKVKLW